MVAVLLVGIIIVSILFGAVRIVAGWLLPAKTMAAVDRLVDKASKLYFQLIVVGVAILIVAAIIVGSAKK